MLQRSVLAPRKALVAFLREFGGDDYFSPPGFASSSSASSQADPVASSAYAEVRKTYVETLSTLLARHLRRYVAAVGRLTEHGGAPPLAGTGLGPQIAPSARLPEPGAAGSGGSSSSSSSSSANVVAGALAAFVDAVSQAAAATHHHSSSSSSSSASSSRSLNSAERGAILLHLDRPALVPGATTAAAAAAPRAGDNGAASSSSAAPSTPEAAAALAAGGGGGGARRPPRHSVPRTERRHRQPSSVPPEEAFRSVCRLLADTATAEYVFCADFFGGDGAFRDGFGGAPLSAPEGFLLAQVADADDPVALLLMARVVRHCALTMARRRVPALDAHHDRLTMAIWPRLQHVLDAHVASLGAVESSGGGSGGGGGGGTTSGIVGFFSAASHHSSFSSPPEPASPGGAVHPLASRSGALEGALLALSSPAEAGQLSMSLRRLRQGALSALCRMGERQLSRSSGGGAAGRAEAAAFVAGNAHAVLGLLEGAAADAAARNHAGGGGGGGGSGSGSGAENVSSLSSRSRSTSTTSSSSFTSPVFAALGAAGADAAAHWHAAFEEAALQVAAEPVGRRFPGLLEAARALQKAAAAAAATKEEQSGEGGNASSSSSLEQSTAAAREALSAAFSPALPSVSSSSPPPSWASSLDAVRADVARYLRKNPGAARAAAALAASAVGGAYAACFEAVVAASSSPHSPSSSSPHSPSSSSPRSQQSQWPAPAVVARECARQ